MKESNRGPAEIVLIAEDETLVRLVANDILTEAGYRVLEARDGQEALALLEMHVNIRVLFTDVRMPNLDGLSLAKLVIDRWPEIGIVITSADSAPGNINAIFLAKPYVHDTLLEAIERALDGAVAKGEG